MCQQQTLQSSPPCRADALKLRDQKSREGRGRAETAVARWSPVCFEVAAEGRTVCGTKCRCDRGGTAAERTATKHCCLLHIHHCICVALLVEALYAAQGQEERAASGKHPIWIQGTGKGRWRQVHLFWIQTGRQPAGLRGGCEVWAASVLQLCLSLPNPIVQQRRREGMGPASLQEEKEPENQSEEEMESYRCLLQAGSQLENTLQREYT